MTSEIKEMCPKCGQKYGEYHSGEYPCSECGKPTVWDVVE